MAKPVGQGGKPTPVASKTPLESRVPGHMEDYLSTILAREAYTKERYFMMTRVVASMALTLLVSLGINAYQASRPVQYRFIATDQSGKIKDLSTLDKPLLTESEVTVWVADAVTKAWTFDFVNYRQELTLAKDNFTPGGWKAFEKALDDAGVLKAVLGNRLVTTAAPTAAPVLQTQGLIEGHYAWRYQLPVLVTYQGGQSGNGKNSQALNVTVIVVRMPETETASGLGIASLIAE